MAIAPIHRLYGYIGQYFTWKTVRLRPPNGVLYINTVDYILAMFNFSTIKSFQAKNEHFYYNSNMNICIV